jgi:hypothetical protein
MFNFDLMRDPAFIGYAHECDHDAQVGKVITAIRNGWSTEFALDQANLSTSDLCPRDLNRIFDATGVDLSNG